MEKNNNKKLKMICPKCGEKFKYKLNELDRYGYIKCPKCKYPILHEFYKLDFDFIIEIAPLYRSNSLNTLAKYVREVRKNGNNN